MLLKEFLDRSQHGGIFWVLFLRHIRRRNNPPLQSIERKQLRIRKSRAPHFRRRKEALNPIRSQVLPLHHLIINPKLAQQPFIAIMKSIATHPALVVNHGTPAAGTQNPDKLSPRMLQIEPMQRLPHRNQI